MAKTPDPQILEDLINSAKAQGADAADALYVESVSASVSYRLGKLEDIERAEGRDLGLRVFVGQKVAFVSSSESEVVRARWSADLALPFASSALIGAESGSIASRPPFDGCVSNRPRSAADSSFFVGSAA